MKIRTGFVSNSSSSSFIIALAVIEDMEKYLSYVKENEVTDEDIRVMTLKELKEKKPWELENSDDSELVIESFMDSQISVKTDGLTDDDSVIVYYFAGNEGDYMFMDDEADPEWADMNYDIALNFFDSQQQKVIDMLTSQAAGLNKDKTQYTWGAGRNG